jgi:hypothetical protein
MFWIAFMITNMWFSYLATAILIAGQALPLHEFR